MTKNIKQIQNLPNFTDLNFDEIEIKLTQIIENSKKNITNLINELEKNQIEPNWDNFFQKISDHDEIFHQFWSPISHLNSVKNSEKLRKIYQNCLPKISEYSTWIGQNKSLFNVYQSFKNSPEFNQLEQSKKKVVENALRDFMLSGIDLAPEKQKRFGEIVSRLSELSSNFSNNVLDATMNWSKLITNENELKGLPNSALEAAKARARSKNEEGFLFTLDIPSYLPVMNYCENRALREEMLFAYSTRASEIGPNAEKWDNGKIMPEILELRFELAKLLGFQNYAEKSLATKMAENPKQVLDFLNNLAKKAKPCGEKDRNELEHFAKETFGIESLEPWDISFFSEKQKQHLYTINDEEFRPYFPEDRVISGLFEVMKRVFSITIKERKNVNVWHKDVRFFDLFNEQNQLKGSFYLDLYARENKRGGAWMDVCLSKVKFEDGSEQIPTAYLTCNFNPPIGDDPALFSHNEVTTLFHEFGHGIHHMLTEINIAGVSGIEGVPWDAVELPSQFLENWCWQEEALEFISSHYKTGEILPKEMLNKMLAAKNYQAAFFILRQLEFALFDFRLHTEFSPEKGEQILPLLYEIKSQVSVFPINNWGRFPHAFSHIFAGGYAAGYYSYLWAEVLAADAFSRFKKEGIFNKETGKLFLNEILSKGGSEDPMQLFINFRGRKPDINALLIHYGIA